MKLEPMVAVIMAFLSHFAFAQNADVLGMHNLSPASGSPVYATGGTLGCTFCHAPHSNRTGGRGLWNQTLSSATYKPYTSTTYHQTGNTQPPLGRSSSLCLSCHDGTVAVGQSSVYGQIPMSNAPMLPGDNFGTDLTGSHPFSLGLQSGHLNDSPDMAASLAANKTTADPLHKVRLIDGNVECTSCHSPHIQRIDLVSPNFLVRDSSNGQMCLSCHDPNRVTTAQVNSLTGWGTSIHATAPNQPTTDAHVGNYNTVAATACISCHMPHDAAGAARLLRPAQPAAVGVDASTQPCLTCHAGGSNLKVAAPNVSAEFAKIGHPYPAGTNNHDSVEALNLPNSPVTNQVLLNNNRHSTCVDCHNPHSANQVGSVFPAPPAIRVSQSGVAGIAADGATVLTPAINQFENCLRCHGASTGKQILAKYGYLPTWFVSAADSLNIIPQFSSSATSSHPVTHDRSSALPQPSLLINMLQLDGITQGRLVGQRVLCTDCHNSDDNREFGGKGPNGPHGSLYPHILERQYQFSQATTPGQTVTNLFPTPDLTVTGPYALCAKCHDLSNVISNASFTQHSLHINTGFSCSVCHTSHGMGAISTTISGERMVNFDANVVAQNGAAPITYNRASHSCTLQCHGYNHNADGSVSASVRTTQSLTPKKSK